ncbi:MAG: flagellar biosynthesis protein FlhB [Syntrophomonadaceae bacterium]|nr:flagellar biosynthesis protein FlhB [Syntrophomonadaceae bacterium]
MDLQLFAGEKTEKATPKRRQEARKKGQVIRSTEVNSALILLLTFFVLYLTLPYIFGEVAKFAEKALFEYTRESFSPEFLHALLIECLIMVGRVTFPVMAVAFVTGLTANYMQVGFLFTTETLKFNPGRLNPIEGFKRIFSKRAIVELFKSLWKVTVVGFVVYSVISDQIGLFPQLMEVELIEVIGMVNQLVWSIAWRVGLLLLILSILDYIFQWWEYEKNLRMSKQEIKDEYKQMEGDPQIRSKIKERQRQMAMQRMMSQVPQADVVITNPTHLAVALHYRSSEMESPVVVAKGQGLVAQRIKEIAQQHGVIIVENKSLAQILYKTVEIGQMVPEELYQAVAEVLAYVYRLKRKAF